MKGSAIVLLCIVALAQGRSTAVESSSRALASLGENPWLVHLRLAVANSGFLDTCAGSLVHQSWVLTTANCIRNSRYIWIRYGVTTVINPELVTETSAIRLHSSDNVALISINRVVEITENIAPVAIASVPIPKSATFCGFGGEDAPGDVLTCFGVSLESQGNTIVAQSEDGKTTRFDIGAPLVNEGVQIGILSDWSNSANAGVFLKAADYASWIEETAGVTL